MHLNPLTTKLVGYITFEPETTLHIGIGEWGVRREIMRIGEGKAVIPASSWKGAFRQIGENIAKTQTFCGLEMIAVKSYVEGERGITYDINDSKLVEDFIKALKGESGFFELTHEDLTKLLQKLDYNQAEINILVEDSKKAKAALANIIALYCPIGKLFGNTVIAGKLRFLDTIFQYKPHLKPGVGIDRSSGTVKENQLYFLEAASIDSNIILKLIADNLEPQTSDSKLFAATLKYIEKVGLQLGARKSTGMGSLRMAGAEFYFVELTKDNGGSGLANPFKYGNKMNLQQLLSYLGFD